MKATIKAYAKINLLLDVLHKRPDGFHEVKMVMQAVRLADQLCIVASKKNRITSNSPYVPNNMNNLALRAVALLQEAYKIPSVDIRLHKAIPVSAGMAGGSTDAAGVLLGLNALFDLGLGVDELADFGSQLGSDVPFCLGGATAMATGRGEEIRPLADCPRLYLVLVKANFGVSTAQVYKRFRLPADAFHPDFAAYEAALLAGDQAAVLAGLYNGLEASTFALYPKVRKVKSKLQSLGARHVLMSGSGPTVFAAFAEQAEAWAFYKKARQFFPRIFLTRTMASAEMADRVQLTPLTGGNGHHHLGPHL